MGELIDRFYGAFAARDSDAMAACYHPRAVFSDPVFPRLEGPRIGTMWRMLCERADDLEITWGEVAADAGRATARWRAVYTFTATGRRVDNRIAAAFEFGDGVILRHVDRFDFWRWSRMALGPTGWLLGWSPLVRNKVRAQADRQLRRYESGLRPASAAG
jgi:ketosteroid isomerase-like protein